MTVGLPGTGLSYTSKLDASGGPPAAPVAPSTSLGCFGWTFAVGIALLVLKIAVDFAAAQPVATAVIVAVLIAAGVYYVRDQRRVAAEVAARVAKEQADYLQRLADSYGQENVERILAGRPWLGCTTAALVEMLGAPAAIDEKVVRATVTLTYKYQPLGGNRYAQRVFLEDGVVIGWENKGDDPILP